MAGRRWIGVLGLWLSCTAWADDETPLTAWDALEGLPPTSAWDLGAHVSYGNIGYWSTETPPWVGFGARGGWGRLVTEKHRLGVMGTISVEGPVPLLFSLAIEPQATWDYVGGGLQVGASLGPALMVHGEVDESARVGVAPMVAARIGYSEPWTRVGRRFFVVVEPKFRLIGLKPDYLVALVIGSGSGR